MSNKSPPFPEKKNNNNNNNNGSNEKNEYWLQNCS